MIQEKRGRGRLGIAATAAMLMALAGVSGCGSDSGGGTTPPPPPPPVTANACQPGNAMQVVVDKKGKTVTAYIPNSDWGGSNGPGIQVVPVEGSSQTCQEITTTDDINSCAYDNTTQQVVCTSNDTNVYVISGTTITQTLNSGGVYPGGVFSGGGCATCNIAMGSGYAVIGIGLDFDVTGYELLDLTNYSFSTPLQASAEISEAPSFDPRRELLLSPNYNSDAEVGTTGGYQIAKINPSTGAVSLYNYSDNTTNLTSYYPDSAGEDCSTGVALSTLEYTNKMFLANLNNATYATSGPPLTWDAPSQIQTLAGFETFTAGTTGIAVAPGSHVALLEDEFGTTAFGAIKLPSTAGNGVPSVVDWVVANMPKDPSGTGWEMPDDPHGLTAYVSPNSKKPIGLITNLSRTYLAVVDINALLKAQRAGTSGSAAHEVNSSVDLLSTGIVKFIPMCATPPPS
jgi:hypothetical protein